MKMKGMSKEGFSLPPLLNDFIQGRLDVIILRPVLFPSLSPHQSLDLKFSWWGSNYIHNVKLSPGAEELKIVFDIHCDFKTLQRYFQDANELQVHISVSVEQFTENAPHNSHSVTVYSSSSSSSPLGYRKYQLRKRKKWDCGDYIGKFVIPNLKLNPRGEYVSDCNVFNANGDQCGSAVVFMLHTNQKSNNHLFTSKEMSQPSVMRDLPTATNSSNHKYSGLTAEAEHERPLCNENSPSDTQYLKSRSSRDNLSPRFISFEEGKRNSSKIRSDRFNFSDTLKTRASPKKKISKELKLTHHVFANSENSNSFESKIMLPDLDSKTSHNPNFILTRLFSFVDSGAIHPSDLPTLIQICQGRSPSIDLNSPELQEGRSFIFTHNEALKDHPNRLGGEDSRTLVSSNKEVYSMHSMHSKGKKSVNFSGISYHSNSWPVECPKVGRVFDDEFLTSLSTKEAVKKTIKGVCKVLGDKNPCSSCNLNETYNSDPENEACEVGNKNETSLLILRFHSIQFSSQDVKDESEEHIRKTVDKQSKRKPVRQRSKLCYFVEVFLEFEGMEKCSQSALYVSRLVENQEVIFSASQIFRLPKPMESQKCEGYLKFKVSCRRLGNRLRDSIGVGIVSLQRLQTNEGEISVLPLWVSSNDPVCSIKSKYSNGNLEMPLGSLHFSVAFAFAEVPSDVHSETSTAFLNTEFDNELEGSCNENDDYDKMNSFLDVPQTLNETSEFQVHCENENASNETSCAKTQFNAALEALEMSNESLVIESSSSVNFIPVRENEREFGALEQEVHLEIIEGNNLPLLRTKGTRQTFFPSSYVQTTISSMCFRTRVVKCTSSPRWNYTTNFKLTPEDLKRTNFHLILKAFHSLKGTSPQSDDPMLGFASVDTQFLWNSFVSLCGWIPILNFEGEICGEIKVSLTPKRSRSWYTLPLKERVDIPFDQDGNTKKSQHELSTTLHRNPDGGRTFTLNSPNFLKESIQSSLEQEDVGSHLSHMRDVHAGAAFQNEGACYKQRLLPKDSKHLELAKESVKLHQSKPRVSFALNPQELCKDSFHVTEEIDEKLVKKDPIRETSMDEMITVKIQSLSERPRKENEEEEGSEDYTNFENLELSVSHSAEERISEADYRCDDAHCEESNDANFKSERCGVTRPASHIVEGLQWMNHFSSFDTPCVSYLDLGHITPKVSGEIEPKINSIRNKNVSKQRKSRIAANLNFLWK